MLLERLDSRRSLMDVDVEEALMVAGRLLRRLSVPAPEGVPQLQAMAEELSESFAERWEELGRPMPRELVERAGALARELGPSAGGLLVNYDLHYANVLAGERAPWLVVDPKVVAGDPEFGIAQLLWRRMEEMEGRGGLDRQLEIVTEAAGLDPQLARLWTLVRRVDDWLWGLSVGLTEDPKRCRKITDWLTG
jgi:streptomycin 6-kinase